jgi:transcription antitermination factor NusG
VIEGQVDPWLVLRTRSHHENIVECCLHEKGITAFLPKYEVVRRRRERRATLRSPLFPGYVFVQPRVDQYENMRYIPGSCGLVRTGSKPAAMPEGDVKAIRMLVGSGAALAVYPSLVPGQKVEVVSGSFAGIQGELVRFKSEERLVINAHLLNSCVSVEVDVDSVRPL